MLHPDISAPRFKRLAEKAMSSDDISRTLMYAIVFLGRMRPYLVNSYVLQLGNMAELEDDGLDVIDERSGYRKLGYVAYQLMLACKEWDDQIEAMELELDLNPWTEIEQLHAEMPRDPGSNSSVEDLSNLLNDVDAVNAITVKFALHSLEVLNQQG